MISSLLGGVTIFTGVTRGTIGRTASLECRDGLGEGGCFAVDADVDPAVAEEHVALGAAVEGRAQRHVVHFEEALCKRIRPNFIRSWIK